MDDESFEITYAAHTKSCTFLLDSEGICRRIVMAPTENRRGTPGAARCIGAQYVASLDPKAAGGITDSPRVGTAMLFAKVDEKGRISLVRTGSVTRFEALDKTEDLTASDTRPTQRRIPTDPYSDPLDRTHRVYPKRHADRLESGVELKVDDDDSYTTVKRPAKASGR